MTEPAALRAAAEWNTASCGRRAGPRSRALRLGRRRARPPAAAHPTGLDAALEEFSRQRTAIAASTDPGRLRLLIAAESAGALIAEELRAAGLPWDAAAHDRILVDTLGERPRGRRRAGEARGGRRARANGAGGPERESRLAAEAAARASPSRRAGRIDEPMGAGRAPASRHRTAARIQEAVPAAVRERVGVARRVGARRAVPTCVRAGWRRDRAMGVIGRRGAAAATAAARGSPSRPWLDAGRGRRRPAGASRARRDVGRSGIGGCRARQGSVRRGRRQRRRGHAIGGEDRHPRGHVRRDDGGVGTAGAAPASHVSTGYGPRRRCRPHGRGRRARLHLARPDVPAAV